MPSTRFSRKRGRPRSSPPHTQDLGTPELQRKRLSGCTADLVDRLHREGKLTDDDLRNAQLFRRLYTIRMGNPLPLALDPSRSSTGAATTRDRSREEQQYRIVSHALHCAGLLNVIIDAVMFETLGEGEWHLKRLRQALQLFARQMRRRESH